MNRRALVLLLAWVPLVEAVSAWLRYCDNRRKNRPLTPPWDYLWTLVLYGCVNGHVPLSDIERDWRDGTPYAYRGRRDLDPDLVGVERMPNVD